MSHIVWKSFLRRLPAYVRRFGPSHGLRQAWSVERSWPTHSAVVKLTHVNGWAHPLLLRANKGDHATFWQCVVQEQYRLDRFPQYTRLQERYRALVDRGEEPLIVDCGANIGLASIWLANAFPKAKVVAIEPQDENFGILKRNIAPYGDRIVPVHGGVWPIEGHVRVENPEAGPAAFRVVTCDASHPGAIQTVTVPSLCERFGAVAPFIVKIDIEGSQGTLFQSNADWVGGASLVVLELDDWQFPWAGTSRSFFAAVSQWPFDYLLGGESIFCFRDHGERNDGR